jgi:hypothetical protein
VGICDLRTLWSPPVSLNQERHTQRRKTVFLFILNLLFLKSPPWNPLLADLITATLFLLKFSFSPGVRAVHRSQFQATFALWSKASNLHYSLMRLPPPPPPPSPAKHSQLSYTGLRHSRGGAGPGPVGLLWQTWPGTPHSGPGRPDVTDLNSVTDGRSEFIYKIWPFRNLKPLFVEEGSDLGGHMLMPMGDFENVIIQYMCARCVLIIMFLTFFVTMKAKIL